MLGFMTQPMGLLVGIPDVVLIIPLFVLSIVGRKRTYESIKEYKIGRGKIIFWSVTFYMGVLWSVHSYVKGTPKCDRLEGMKD